MSDLKIRETAPFYVLPTQRYDLTTKPPSKSMQKDFTFFMSFKVDKIINTKKPCSLMMRPGMHYGLCYQQDPEAINFEYWYEHKGENKFGFVSINLHTEYPVHNLHNIWFVIVKHNVNVKTFTLSVYNEDGNLRTTTGSYDGELVDYSQTPYNFGCGNYFKQVDDSHYFFSDYTMFNTGLIETIHYTDKDIQKFIKVNRKSTDKLVTSTELNNMVFYFNFNAQNLYKVWDLSDHCNFLMRNMDVFK